MPTPTYELIETTTLSSSASSVTFSSITQDYRDLVLVCTVSSASGGGFQVRINSDSGSNYPAVQMIGNGSSAISSAPSGETGLIGTYVRTYPVMQRYEFLDYSATDKHKSVLSRSDAASNDTRAVASRWANTSAITALEVLISANTFDTGSTFQLFGIAS